MSSPLPALTFFLLFLGEVTAAGGAGKEDAQGRAFSQAEVLYELREVTITAFSSCLPDLL